MIVGYTHIFPKRPRGERGVLPWQRVGVRLGGDAVVPRGGAAAQPLLLRLRLAAAQQVSVGRVRQPRLVRRVR